VSPVEVVQARLDGLTWQTRINEMSKCCLKKSFAVEALKKYFGLLSFS
jgi:hypothetical protein